MAASLSPRLAAAADVHKAVASFDSIGPRNPDLAEVLKLTTGLTESLQNFFGSLDKTVYSELRYIADYIAKTRDEVAELRPNDLREDRIPSAGAELEAIVSNTADATNKIMTAAETIMAGDPTTPDYQDMVMTQCMDIFEACSFQDITGQRVSKVVSTLSHIEERLERFSKAMGVKDAAATETDADRRKKALLLNGPSLNGPEVNQNSIDDMFDGSGQSNQSDIDDLFA